MPTKFNYELVDLGIDHSDYFQGFGVYGTPFTNCCYGIGSDPLEALNDALEQYAISENPPIDSEELFQDIVKHWSAFTNERRIKQAAKEVADGGDDCYYHIGLRW